MDESGPIRVRLTRDGRILVNDRWPSGTWWTPDLVTYSAKVPLHELKPMSAWLEGIESKQQLRQLVEAIVRESPRWADRERWAA